MSASTLILPSRLSDPPWRVGQQGDGVGPAVVAGAGVLGPGVAEADDEPVDGHGVGLRRVRSRTCGYSASPSARRRRRLGRVAGLGGLAALALGALALFALGRLGLGASRSASWRRPTR